jgi:undecaprenyl-phosphate galactose phosphotransferase
MSLVGPRPVLPYEYELLDDWQKEILTVLPGMTGLWQVRGRSEVNFEDQYVLDLYYVRNKSIWLDIEILFNTVSVVLSGKSGL